jgi:hypothetical protein
MKKSRPSTYIPKDYCSNSAYVISVAGSKGMLSADVRLPTRELRSSNARKKGGPRLHEPNGRRPAASAHRVGVPDAMDFTVTERGTCV